MAIKDVVGATTAYASWSRLQTTYASGSRTQIRALKNALHALSRDNDCIATYMDRAKHIFNQLVELDAAISEDDLIDHILHGLGLDYRPFTCNIEARLTSISFDDLFGLLLSEEMQLKNFNDSLNTHAVAHYTTRQNTTGGTRGRSRGSRRGGHQSNSGRGHSPSYNNESFTLTCYNCRGQGHTSKHCLSLKYNTYIDHSSKPIANYTSSC
ncbi:uncharacterized protein LOC131180155 [Hevea brasiliensis]|uniref:uncharacterized protein LOC131180155 n=1 Tax=Hevea brasiliensis TaxID=3981 RepID=UPI0025D87351|nr:uncharacterized protein LOC131180155 [Hevea brasiliensis]